jgi:dTDP-4-dehydrorhamnose reductase
MLKVQKNLVKISKIINSKFIYISTDYVFNGNKNEKYMENDFCSPKSIYGTTKYLGELETKKNKKHFILRVSWLFGKNGNNFVKKIIDLSKHKKVIRVVSDQIGSPTYTLDLSKKIIQIMTSNMYGTYHISNEGSCSWYVFAKFILKYIGSETIVESVKTIDFPQKASRPLNSVLSNEKLIKSGFGKMPTWEDALKRFLTEIGELK